jgi:hypothetical protein
LPTPQRQIIRLALRGEYQVRLPALSDLRLRPHPLDSNTDTLGQTSRLQHWQRITPVLQIQDQVLVVAQADAPRGLLAGRENQYVAAADEPLDERQPLRLDLRWLFVEWLSPTARVSAGQQPSHFGLGIVENDGDHPPLFGDYQGGNRVERLQLALRPLGARSAWCVRLAGDLVYRDPLADLAEGDVALRAVLSTDYEDNEDRFVALHGAFRHQRRQDDALPGFEFYEELDWFTLISSGRLRAPLPGFAGWLFAEYEAAVRLGTTSALRTVAQQRAEERERIQATGAVARLGAAATAPPSDATWAKLVAMLEWGWASGDADPYDGTFRRFDFHPSYNVGLILFDEVLAWKTARAASIASDPSLVARPEPGWRVLASNGAVFGATYVSPSLVWRPVRPFDVKFAAVVAQTTTDLVDPGLVATTGNYQNYDGGDPANHDLGLELDAGIEYRQNLEHGLVLQTGAQGAVLFPGNALADAAGRRLDTQYLAMARLGLLY